MAIQKTQGIVLNNYDFRETSLIATFYTKGFGKIRGLVKGIKRPKIRYGSRLQPFSFNDIVFYDNRKSNFCIIAQCDRIDGFNNFGGDLEKAAYASYMLELIDAVTPLGDVNIALFDLLINALELFFEEDDIERTVRIFEIRLLNLSGFMPRLDCCVNCEKKISVQEKIHPRFSHSLGGLICASCFNKDKAASPISLGAIASLEHIESIEWQRVLRFKFTPTIRGELEKILRSFISLHLEKKFKALDFLEKARNFYPLGKTHL